MTLLSCPACDRAVVAVAVEGGGGWCCGVCGMMLGEGGGNGAAEGTTPVEGATLVDGAYAAEGNTGAPQHQIARPRTAIQAKQVHHLARMHRQLQQRPSSHRTISEGAVAKAHGWLRHVKRCMLGLGVPTHAEAIRQARDVLETVAVQQDWQRNRRPAAFYGAVVYVLVKMNAFPLALHEIAVRPRDVEIRTES